MRTARLARLALLALLSLAAPMSSGCASEVAVGPDAARGIGLRSFTGTVTKADLQWSWGDGGAAVSVGKAARFDVRVDESGFVELVAMTPFGEVQRATGALGSPTVVRLPSSTAGYYGGLVFSGDSNGYAVSESYDTFEIGFDAAGAPTSIVATGQANAFAGDVGMSGTVKATIALAPDAIAPTWTASAVASFADRALPWDARGVMASEPYEGSVAFADLFPGADPAAFDLTREKAATDWGAPPVTRERGVTLTPRAWDAADALVARSVGVRDVAGNVASVGPLAFSTIHLDPPTTAVLASGASPATRWGSPTLQADCGDGKPCTVLGPFRQSFCGGGSVGGFAARLLGAGHATFRLRVTATSSFGGGWYGQMPVHVLATNPGQAPVVEEPLALSGGDGGGSFDSGWKTVTLTTPDAHASETGVAISAGGKGAGPSMVDCGPAPAPVDVTVYVGEVAIVP
jgi:hypothetical protein